MKIGIGLSLAVPGSAAGAGVEGPVAPTNTTAPSISGTATVGETLTASEGTWTGSPTLTLQWLRDGVEISGATGASYTLVAADAGAAISLRVTATNAGGSATAVSAGVGPVGAAEAPVLTLALSPAEPVAGDEVVVTGTVSGGTASDFAAFSATIGGEEINVTGTGLTRRMVVSTGTLSVLASVSIGGTTYSASASGTVAASATTSITPLTLSSTSLTAGDTVTISTVESVTALTAAVNGVAQSVSGTGTVWTVSDLDAGGLTISATNATGTVTAKALVANVGATSRDLSEPWAFIGASMTDDLEVNLPKALTLAGGTPNGKYMFRSASGFEDMWTYDGVDTTGTADADPTNGAPSMKTALKVGDRKVFMAGDTSGGYYDLQTYESMYKWDEVLTRNGVTDRYFYFIHYSTMPTAAQLTASGYTGGDQASFRDYWHTAAVENLSRKEAFLAYYNANRVPGTKPWWAIPVLQIYLAIYDAIEAGTAHSEITTMGQFFQRASAQDGHMKDLGLYVVALAHYATAWRRKPEGMFFTQFYPSSNTGTVSDDCSAWLIDTIWNVISARTDNGMTDTYTYPAIAARAGAAETVKVGVTTPGASSVVTSNGISASPLALPGSVTGVPAGTVTVGTDNASAVSDEMSVLGLGAGADLVRAMRVEAANNTTYTFGFPAETQVGDRVVCLVMGYGNAASPFYHAGSAAEAEVARKTFWGSSQQSLAVRSGSNASGASTDRRYYATVNLLATADNLASTITVAAAKAFYVTLVLKGDATIAPYSNTFAAETAGVLRAENITYPAVADAANDAVVLTVLGASRASGYGLKSSDLYKQWYPAPARMPVVPSASALTAVQHTNMLFQIGLEYPDGAMAAETVDTISTYPWSYEALRLLVKPA